MSSRGLLASLSQHSNCLLSCTPKALLQLPVNRCSHFITGHTSLSANQTCIRNSSTHIAVAAGAGEAESAAGGPKHSGGRRRRKLFNTNAQDPAPATALQQQEQLQDRPPPNRRRSTATATTTQKQQPQQQQQRLATDNQLLQQQQQQQQQQQEQQQQGWWEHPAAASDLLVHVFWDLDNLNPVHWNQAEELVGTLKTVLRPYGRLQTLQAYANSRTLVSTVEMEGVLEMVEEDPDELRCPMCGKRCKSFDDLQKHFKQLHEREHQKKMRGPRKFVAKYVKSDKAERVRDAGRLYGTPKKNRSGRRGQMVKVILQRAGVKVIEVASQKQAADDAVNRHMDSLIQQLKAQDQKPLSTKAKAAAASSVPPWRDAPFGDNALQQSVLVLVSDDRGFASSIARWLQRGGVGAMLVTTRSSSGWEQPLTKKLGNGSRLRDVVCLSWGDIMGCLDDGDSSGWDSDDDFYDDPFAPADAGYYPGSYEWMVAEGLL